MRTARWTALALTGVVAALLAAPAAAQGVELKPEKKPKPDKYLITADEIAARADLKDGYDVVRLLRNQWLKPTRPSGSALGAFASGSGSRQPVGGCNPNSTDPACKGVGGDAGAGSGTATPVPSERGSAYADADGASGNSKLLPVIYIDELKRQGVDDLRTLQPADIFEIRFLTGNQASGRYGAGHEYGAIMVKTIRFGKG